VWKSAAGEIVLKQDFQKVTGTVKSGNVSAPISRGRVNGDQISFVAGGAEYRGRVNGTAIEGTVKADGKSGAWKASRS
jgi:hypothetical protein